MPLFTLLHHIELLENPPPNLAKTRSFKTSRVGRFLYLNSHIEHHLYPQVPFYALLKLRGALADQVPEPGPGDFHINFEDFLHFAAVRSAALLHRAKHLAGAANENGRTRGLSGVPDNVADR